MACDNLPAIWFMVVLDDGSRFGQRHWLWAPDANTAGAVISFEAGLPIKQVVRQHR